MMARRGRRPKVHRAEGSRDYHINVGTAQYAFRAGDDGKLRALGQVDRTTEDFAFAKELVAARVAVEGTEEE